MNNSDFDIDSFLTNLKKICDAGVTQPVITRQLLNFNLNISPSIFCKKLNKNGGEKYFVKYVNAPIITGESVGS